MGDSHINNEQIQPRYDGGAAVSCNAGSADVEMQSTRRLVTILAKRLWRPCLLMSLLISIFFMASVAIKQSNKVRHAEQTIRPLVLDKESESLWRVMTWEPITAGTIGLVFVGGGQAALFFWQLRLIRDGARDARDAATAAMKSANATSAQLRLFENLERPWVFFVPPAFGKIGYSNGGTPRIFPAIDFTLRNFGRSPAVIEATEVVLAVTRDPPVRVDRAPLPYVDGNSRHPRDRWSYRCHHWTNPVIPPGECFDRSDLQSLSLTTQQQADLATGSQRLWIDGRVTYTDVFGEHRRQTQFRYAYDYPMDILVQEGGREFNWQT